jgi:hypothetical protein
MRGGNLGAIVSLSQALPDFEAVLSAISAIEMQRYITIGY